MENPPSYKWCWLVQHCNACMWRLVDMEHNTHNALMMGLYGGHCGTMLWHMWEAGRTICRPLLKRLAKEGGMCVQVCRCSRNCKCKAPTPKFEWMQQAVMPKYWKYMVAMLTAAGVVDLLCCLSYEQIWQRCGECNMKALREGGGDAHDSTGAAGDESRAKCAKMC